MGELMTHPDFAKIYKQHKTTVWQLVSRYVYAHHDREDLFQEVFLKIHKALPKFRGESEIGTWIYRLTVNTALNFIKSKQRYAKFRQVLEGLRLVEASEEDERPEVGLHKPLAKLNPKQRMVLILADVEEKKLDEIAKIMSMPVGTVKSALHRAREIVKKELRNNG